MGRRRGLGNAERYALDMANVSATGIVAGTANVGIFVYSLDASMRSSSATATFSIADTTAAADVVKESKRLNFTLGAGGAAGFPDRLSRNFMPPLYCERALYFANEAGGPIDNVSITYQAAS